MKKFNHEDKLAEQILSWDEEIGHSKPPKIAPEEKGEAKAEEILESKLSKNTKKNFSDNPLETKPSIDENNKSFNDHRPKAEDLKKNKEEELDLPWTFALGSAGEGEKTWEKLAEEQLNNKEELDPLDSILSEAAANLPQEWINKHAHHRFKQLNEELAIDSFKDEGAISQAKGENNSLEIAKDLAEEKQLKEEEPINKPKPVLAEVKENLENKTISSEEAMPAEKDDSPVEQKEVSNGNEDLPEVVEENDKIIPLVKQGTQKDGVKTVKKKVRRPRYKRILLLIFILLLPFIIYFGYSLFNKPFSDLHNDKVINVLLLGVDKRHNDGGRSDTMMVLSLNRETKQLSILSLPRDTRVEVKPGDYEKLNHAYAYGGVKLAQEVVEKLLNLPIDYYLEIDLQAFEQFIDDIGGIDIDIPKRMYYEDPYDDNGGLVIDFQPGLQHLNGLQAMEYVRYRDEAGDIGRIQRQQDFIQGVLKKVVNPEIVVQLPKIITNIMKETNTNLASGEIIALLKELPEIKAQGLKTYTLPGKPAYIQGVSYWLPEFNEDRSVVAALQGLEYKPTEDDQAYQNKYNESLPPKMHKLADGTEVYDDQPEERAADVKEVAKSEEDPKAEATENENVSPVEETGTDENKQVENE